MTSPFPGMDPYLESHWGDIHSSLVLYARDQIQQKLPNGLRARVEERVYLEDPEDAVYRSVYPDVRMIVRAKKERIASEPDSTSSIAVADSAIIHLPVEPLTETFLQIVDASSGHRVVTILEFLSPAKKLPGEGKRQYDRKQKEIKNSGVNLVEIDLIRVGTMSITGGNSSMPTNPDAPYRICVTRATNKDLLEFYPIGLKERLPAIRIPLRERDQDAILDLQLLLEQAYQNGAYDDIDDRRSVNPPLKPEDEKWVDELLRSKGLR